jgi:hypothetical protein
MTSYSCYNNVENNNYHCLLCKNGLDAPRPEIIPAASGEAMREAAGSNPELMFCTICHCVIGRIDSGESGLKPPPPPHLFYKLGGGRGGGLTRVFGSRFGFRRPAM